MNLPQIIAALSLSLIATFNFAAPVSYESTLADSAFHYSITTTVNDPGLSFGIRIDYDQVVEGTAFYQELYPYALMSYFAEMYKTISKNKARQNALEMRHSILSKAGYQAIEDISFIPQSLHSLFIHAGSSRKIKSRARRYLMGFMKQIAS